MRSGNLIWLYLLVFLILGVPSCRKEVVITGRKQLSMASQKRLQKALIYDYQLEIINGQLAIGTEEDQMVKAVGARLRKAFEDIMIEENQADRLENYQWEFQVIVNELPAAFAIPGGKVMFYTGIMPICKDENGVAVAMGHELGHVMANHFDEAYTKRELGEFAVEMFIIGVTQGQSDFSVYDYSDIFSITLDQNQLMMLEADRLGLILMARAGYNPDAVIGYLARYDSVLEAGISNSKTIGYNPEYFVSHRQDSIRTAIIIHKLLPEARQIYEKTHSDMIQ